MSTRKLPDLQSMYLLDTKLWLFYLQTKTAKEKAKQFTHVFI